VARRPGKLRYEPQAAWSFVKKNSRIPGCGGEVRSGPHTTRAFVTTHGGVLEKHEE